ncbi:MAG: DivIVA domain-containing protein [Myxococcota bacterium]|jgi:cell division initiation protein|nr:DivIVA domain-containing protein [Myxococcota bacterium]MEC9389824.1 DivIVA domain-containing protein [Myxococcota bacterium]
MRVTPLDIIQKQFTANRRGYEPDEVRAFLEETRETLEDLLKENQRLREQIARFEAEIAELRSEEHEVKETLQLARQVKEEMERTARRESDVVLGEARLEAEKIIMAAGDEKRDIQAELVGLRSQKAQLFGEMRGIIETHIRLLDDLDAESEDAAAR